MLFVFWNQIATAYSRPQLSAFFPVQLSPSYHRIFSAQILTASFIIDYIENAMGDRNKTGQSLNFAFFEHSLSAVNKI